MLINSSVNFVGLVACSVFYSKLINERVKVQQRGQIAITRQDRSLLRKKYSKKIVDGQRYDVVVIGSGMGALSCGAVLSRLGRRVLVLEQHPDVAGGGTHQFDIGGYRFDSGLHYTVPWSTPVFALTCLLRPADVTPFTLMGEADGTVDNIYLNVVNAVSTNPGNIHFKMTIYEKYLPELYRLFPDEKKALDEFMKISNDAMIFIKVYIASRLFPQWLQKWYWKLVPKNITDVASVTAEDILPKLTKNKKLIALLSSMWIDTGARPDQASFTMTAAVFRGISMEGGCYPSRGAEEMAIELARVINSHNGTILINAPVQEILIDPCTYVVAGVKMSDNNVIAADRVVSSAGYAKTFQSLVPAQITEVLKIPKIVPGIRQSAGFVMVNIGIKATAEEIGASSSNTWHIPMDASGDSFEPMRKYFANPLEVGSDMPAFITFPSCKDKKWEASHPGRVSCQMLFMADYDWFSKYSGRIRKPSSESSDNSIVIEYNSIKDSWKSKGLEIFLKYFPAAKDRIEVVDISTPLSAEDYLSAYRGSAVGIDVTPQRFVDKDIRNLLDPVVPTIKGLFLTGQDTLICGVTLAQLSGVITAFRMEGLFAAFSTVMKAILLT